VTQSARTRLVAYLAGILFFLSCVFPFGAGLAKDLSAFPRWWGPADVGLAFALAVVSVVIQIQARGVDQRARDTAYSVYRTCTHALIAVAALAIAAGDRVRWANCATGFLGRAGLALYILPWWLVALRSMDGTAGDEAALKPPAVGQAARCTLILTVRDLLQRLWPVVKVNQPKALCSREDTSTTRSQFCASVMGRASRLGTQRA
jgi:hypothetical protein